MVELDKAPVASAVGPRRDGIDTPFWEGLQQGKLHLQRCSGCQTWWWAPVWHCSKCDSWDMEWPEVPMRGTIYSWVRTHQAFLPSMASIVPYVTILVELPDAGNRRIFGLLVGPDEKFEIGDKVVGVIQQPSELTRGMPVLRWQLGEW